MQTPWSSAAALLTVLALCPLVSIAEDADQPAERVYANEIQPLLKQFCHACHSGDQLEADIDLAGFKTVADLRRDISLWQRVDEMLATDQMPPIDSQQPNDQQRRMLRNWVHDFLISEARAQAGDPGPVVLRRLSNAEYTYTIRDLTGIESLDPAREFPIDGAAGEGFTNAGSGLVMSPSLVQKYLVAGKQIARYAALMPDGVRFTPYTSQRDLTDDALKRIRDFYARYTVGGGGSKVNLQGIQFDTNQGGLLPIESYLHATIAERDSLAAGEKSIQQVASDRKLSPVYLDILWRDLNSDDDSIAMTPLREAWRTATINDIPALRAQIATWQTQLWKSNVVGHLGREGAPQSWLEPLTPIVERREFRWKLPPASGDEEIVIHLVAGDAGDGNEHDFALWRDLRLEAEGKPPINLRDLRGIQQLRRQWNRELLARSEDYLAAATESDQANIEKLAADHDLNPSILRTWLKYLNRSVGGPVQVQGHLTNQLASGSGHAFINGWGRDETPLVIANSSDQQVRIPGTSRPHGIVVHPSPTLFVAVGWQSPIDVVVEVEASVAHAHPDCGNGIEWLIQHRFGTQLSTLANGVCPLGKSAKPEPITLSVHEGEVISLLVGPRDGSHVCDLTAVDLTITATDGEQLVWDLGKDVSPNILAGNPHPDRRGNPNIWHFYSGPMSEVQQETTSPPTIPAGSLLADWQNETNTASRRALAKQIAAMANGDVPRERTTKTADIVLYNQLHSLMVSPDDPYLLSQAKPDPRFGTHPLGDEIEPDQIVVQAPSTLTFQLPTELAANRELVVVGTHDVKRAGECSMQLLASTTPNDQALTAQPVICQNGSQAEARIAADFKKYRNLFPIALCYTKIVPVDEVVTATLFHREDELFQDLMLSDPEKAELDRIWDELIYVSEAPLKQVVALEQIREFSTQDRQDLVGPWDKLKPTVLARAAEFRQQVADTQALHVQSVIDFAQQAWRRPLTKEQRTKLESLYARLRSTDLSHAAAIRLLIARILTSPAFLYRQETSAGGTEAHDVDDFELANRLSYFLWSSQPDQDLRAAAAAGQLTKADSPELVSQTRRLLHDEKTRRLAIHFACQWLHLRDFDQTVEKNESLFPEFATLRQDMYQETVQFFEDLFRNDRSILTMFDTDHSFLNESLAKFYGIDQVIGPQWRRVEGMKQAGRGGLLGMATVLASQSGVSRTSPILRGNWVSETLLGERLPKPPANVPQLPESLPAGLSARELIERHSSAAGCARCHQRIDPFGFTLEQFDTIGRRRPSEVNVNSRLPDGQAIEGIDGLKNYLLRTRRQDVLRQFCRKLLGYALGREVLLSDESLLEQMQQNLEQQDFRFSVAVETIVLSKQFQQIRGRDFVDPAATD